MSTHQENLATGFGVLNGSDPNTVFAFMAGASGCIWGGQYIAKVKTACRLRGFDRDGVRAPLLRLDANDAGKLAQLLEPLNQESPS